MNSTFFTEEEDLYAIIANELQNLDKNIKKIATGWTNIVLEVVSNNENYIVRLPRNDFFSKQIEKDVKISNFIRNNIGINTSEMEIKYNKNRPFSIHKKIEGNSLTERMPHLTSNKLNKIAENIARVNYKFHSFDISKLPDCFKIRFYEFLNNLPKLNEENYDFSIFNEMLEDEEKEEKVFVYGDLNIGNIILDENDEIKAFIDFSFCGLSDIYSDITRISCRINSDFFDKIISEYEKLSQIKLNKSKIENRQKMWNYIEREYINYMRNVFPKIKV